MMGEARRMTVYLSLFVAIIGAVVYFITSHPKAAELARLSFATGLLAFLITFARSAVLQLHN